MTDDLPVARTHADDLPRISDRDRDQTVARLRHASGEGVLDIEEFADRVELVYRARTHDDLALIAHDLPELPAEPTEAPTRPPVRWTVAVASSQRRRGPWRPAPRTRAVSVFGMSRLDLTEVELGASDELEILATIAFGGVEVVVPDGARVELGGWVLAGSSDYKVRPFDRTANGAVPVITVRARGAFGGVTVRSKPLPVP